MCSTASLTGLLVFTFFNTCVSWMWKKKQKKTFNDHTAWQWFPLKSAWEYNGGCWTLILNLQAFSIINNYGRFTMLIRHPSTQKIYVPVLLFWPQWANSHNRFGNRITPDALHHATWAWTGSLRIIRPTVLTTKLPCSPKVTEGKYSMYKKVFTPLDVLCFYCYHKLIMINIIWPLIFFKPSVWMRNQLPVLKNNTNFIKILNVK